MPSRPRRTLLLAGCALLVAAPAARAGSTTVSKGGLSATLTWTGTDATTAPDAHLAITRAGTRLLDRDLAAECNRCDGVVAASHPLHVRDLDADGEPEVFVDLYTGGAHCCSSTLIYYLAAGAYRHRVGSWGNGFYRLRDLDHDGRLEFVTSDDRFAYAFAAYAFSWRPPLIYAFSGQRLVERTRRFPSHVRADVRAIRTAMNAARSGGDVRGLVAGRVADLYLLGRGDVVSAYLAAELRRGDLHGDPGWPSGRNFKPALLKFLRKLGYR